MRIVDRATFMTLPAKTVYQKYEPCIFGPVSIKMDSIDTIDWFDLVGVDHPDFAEAGDSAAWVDCCAAMERGEQRAAQFDVWCRDGLFDDGQLFAVWSPDDVRGLIGALQQALPGC